MAQITTMMSHKEQNLDLELSLPCFWVYQEDVYRDGQASWYALATRCKSSPLSLSNSDSPVGRLRIPTNHLSNCRSPNFVQIYEVAGLAANVTAQLPTGTSGASIGILVAIILYAATTLMFVMALLPSVWIHGPISHGIHGKKAPSLKQ
jgi:hypothetical protein